jgi:hypothetical protein
MTDHDQDKHRAATEDERRALDSDEMDLADKARNPRLANMTDSELSDLVQLLRSRRDRARDIANRQGREARAKSAPSGIAPASGNRGTLAKHEYLGAALDRAMAERAARDAAPAEGSADNGPTQRELAENAMALKLASGNEPGKMTEDGGPLHPHDPDASAGKQALADTARNTAPSGALDHAGELPSRERSRTRY